MATQLTIVNNILEELREDTVASVNENPYSKLIARFVNRAKQDLEDMAYDWSAYVTTINTTVLGDSSTTLYELTSTNDRAWLMRQEDENTPMAFITTDEYKGQCYDIGYDVLLANRAMGSSTQTTERPSFFSILMNNTNRAYDIEILYPNTNEVNLRTVWYVPQAELARDGSDDGTQIKLPQRPIELRALFYAQSERGEEMGQPNGVTWSASELAIAAAMENDMQVMKKYRKINVTNFESL